MAAASKKVWGSHPGRERGGASRSEQAYVKAMLDAFNRGKQCAGNPQATEAWCPAKLDENERSYWLKGFRDTRRIVRV